MGALRDRMVREMQLREDVLHLRTTGLLHDCHAVAPVVDNQAQVVLTSRDQNALGWVE